MFHGRVKGRGKQESDPGELQTAFHRARVGFHGNLQRLQDIGGSAMRGDRSIAVFRDNISRARHDKRRGGRNVEGAFAVPSGAAGVDDRAGLILDRDCRGAHRFGGAGNFFHRFTLHPQGG